jgi:mannose-6-phosphate isomerase-like protein (cupin superfamily)
MIQATHGTWGERVITFKWDGGISTILYLLPNQRCSWHSHKASWNQFFVVSGLLGVKTDKGHTSVLKPRQSFTVEPSVKHEFQTYDQPAVIEEIAYVQYDPNDIERGALGGTLENVDTQ